jgi:serine/threonine-protein kinase
MTDEDPVASGDSLDFSLSDGYVLEQLQPGTILGGYQLVHPIARGGMGQVWAARRTGRLGLPQTIAIKTALAGTQVGPELTEELFFDEARVAAAIDHPNVCRVYDLGEDSGVLYIAMEWIDGVSLTNLMGARGKPRHLDPAMAAYIVAQACAGLHAAHELRDEDGVPLDVIHRDATAQNILVSVNGTVKVVDFGIVKSRDQSHQATQTGQLKGKFSYFAPEQLLGKEYDRRVDIFALGCVLYFLATGVRAFAGTNPGATMMKIVRGELAPPSRRVEGFPPKLEAIIRKALASDKEERFATAQEMKETLEQFMSTCSYQPRVEDLAQLVSKTVGPAVERRRADIRESLRLFDSQSKVCAHPGLVASASRVEQERSITAEYSELSVAERPPCTITPHQMSTSYGRHRRVSQSAAVLGLAALVGGVVWWGFLGQPARASSTGLEQLVDSTINAVEPDHLTEKSAETESDVAPLPAKMVSIQIRTVPRQATLSLDEGPEVKAPHTLSVAADDEPHELVASAPGYHPLKQSVRLDRSQKLTLRLKPRIRRRTVAAAAATEEPPAEKSTTEAQAPTPARPGVSLRPTGPKHAIDFDDPFAK